MKPLLKSDSIKIAITPGEPAGVGADLLVTLAQQRRQQQWIAIADRDELALAAQRLSLRLSLNEDLDSPSCTAGSLTIRHVAVRDSVVPGVLNTANAPYVLETLEIAADGALQGDYQALVTGPVQKSVINDFGVPFSGHTEFFRDRAGVDDVLMLLVAGSMRVALTTTHLPLRQVPDAITRELLERQLHLLLAGLSAQFGIHQPRVLVAGLNPHAGEGGHLGREEIDVIIPVCEKLRAQGVDLVGPLPADTMFTPRLLDTADAVLAMYHDQGLPVLKHHGFGEAVNVTLGLPYIRTSVDHGTALDLAGSGRAESGSLAAALRLAAELGGVPSPADENTAR